MNRGRIRTHVLGERLRQVPVAFAVGVVAALALELFLALLETGPGFAVLTVITYLVGAAALTSLALRWSGGLVTVWAIAFPAMYAFAWRLFSAVGTPPPRASRFLAPAAALTLGVGTALYVLGTAARWALRRSGLSPASDDPAEAGVAGAVRRNRRAVLLGGFGGALTLTAGVGRALGWWCRAEPADCRVENGLPRTVDVEVTVRRQGDVVFTASPSLGPTDDTRTGQNGAQKAETTFESAVPIGCSFPATTTVTVAADGRSTTETATFPEPDLSDYESLMGSALDIRVTDEGVEVEARNLIAVA